MVIKQCKYCVEVIDDHIKTQATPWRWPDRPWHRIRANFAGSFLGYTFFIVIYAYSKLPEIFIANSMSAITTANNLEELFSAQGLPHHLVTDSGSRFTSQEFQKFVKNNGIKHTFVAPKKPATNGRQKML